MTIFLTGAPGTGKSTVGRVLSQKLNVRFFEVDEIIQRKTGRSIKELFERGERYFRLIEAEAIEEICAGSENAVVSLGGGAVLSPDNFHLMRKKGIVVNITARPDVILKRLEQDETVRPLLSDNPKERLRQLLLEREKLYRICDFHVDTTAIAPEIAANQIISFISQLNGIDIVRVNLYDRSYDVIIGHRIPKIHIQNRVTRAFPDLKKTILISTPSIRSVVVDGFVPYESVRTAFKEISDVLEIDLPDGEHTKDIIYSIYLWNRFSDFELRKSDLVVSIGGGVLGDLVGFVCSSYLRGVRYINVPTTLLAQVDSSIGGKTAVNTERAKNVIGTIYQPTLVLSDVGFVRTLSEADFISGMGEVVKYSICFDRGLFDLVSKKREHLLARDIEVITDVVNTCARIKAEVVSQDELEEKGVRFSLNFGHTIGHAIEASFDFKIPHGFAVALGSVVETKISDIILGKNLHRTVSEFVRSLGFSDSIQISDRRKFISALRLDKKTRADHINFVLLEEIGRFRIERIRIDDFIKILSEVMKIRF